jgi:hypothetical protein
MILARGLAWRGVCHVHGMATVVGLFGSADRALAAIEALRGARLNSDNNRLVGGAEHVAELAQRAGASANLAAGPPGSVVDGLLESDLPLSALVSVRRRIEEGGALVLGDELDEESATTLVQHLREHGAENVIVEGA